MFKNVQQGSTRFKKAQEGSRIKKSFENNQKFKKVLDSKLRVKKVQEGEWMFNNIRGERITKRFNLFINCRSFRVLAKALF